MGQVNWGKLYDQGRCREVGISWTEEEAVEIFVKKTATFEEVRARYYPAQIQKLENKIEDAKIDVVITGDVPETPEFVTTTASTTDTDEVINIHVDDVVLNVDEAPTVIEKVEVKIEKDSELDDLKREATDLGVKFASNIGKKKLKERIEEAKNKS